jgi:tetratricopeptide (TPR) repeat protein
MAGVIHARGHDRADVGCSEGSWQAIQHLQDVFRCDSGQTQDQDQAADCLAALYNVAVIWAAQADGPSDEESRSHLDAMVLLKNSVIAQLESIGTCPRISEGSKQAEIDGSSKSSMYVLFAPQQDIAALGRREVEHMAARAALRCADWSTASDAYAKLLDSFQGQEQQQQQPSDTNVDNQPRAGVGCIDCIHREYCLALLRSAECTTLAASVEHGAISSASDSGNGNGDSYDESTSKRRTAVSLCEHVLKYRPNDVMLLLLLSEAQYDLGDLDEALRAAQVATQTVELLKSQLLACNHQQAQSQDSGKQDVSRRNGPNYDRFLATLAVCGLAFSGTRNDATPDHGNGQSLRLGSLLAEGYHQTGAILWRLGRHDEAIDSHFLADRCLPIPPVLQSPDNDIEAHRGTSLSGAAGTAGMLDLQGRVVFSLTLALWACGRRQEAAERWCAYRGWNTHCSSSTAASAFPSEPQPVHEDQVLSRKRVALQGQLDCVVSDVGAAASSSKSQQQRFLMDRLAAGQLAS